jgi:two-component system, NarL family, sensor kinase
MATSTTRHSRDAVALPRRSAARSGRPRPWSVVRRAPSEDLPWLDNDGAIANPTVQGSGWRCATALVVVALGVLLPLAWLVWARVLAPSDGTLVLPSEATWGESVPVQEVYPDSPLRAGDLVLYVDGVSVERWLGRAAVPGRLAGEVLTYGVRRDGQVLDVPVRLSHYDVAAVAGANAGLGVLVGIVLLLTTSVFLARPADAAARTMFAVASLLLTASSTYPMGLQVVDLASARGPLPFLVGDFAATLFWGALLHFTVVFPQRSPLVQRWPWSVAACYALPFALYAGYILLRLPGTPDGAGRWGLLLSVSTPAARIVPVLALARVVWTYRKSTNADDRRRLRWVISAFAGGFTAYVGLGQIPSILTGQPLVSWQWLLLVLMPTPLAIAAGILRYRLFDLEVILTRSLLYGALTAAVVGAYALSFLVLRALPGAGRPLVSFGAGLVVAATFFPLRTRLHRRVSRVIYGARDDPYEVVSRLDRLDVGESMDRVLPAVVETLARALRLPYAAIELKSGQGVVLATAAFGQAAAPPVRLPVYRHGQVLGGLLLDVGPGKEPFGPADRRLLLDVARRVGEAAHAALIFADLQRSRENLLVAREEERRRLRRDLHDGVGPSLAAMGMQLEVVQDLVQGDPPAAAALVERVSDTTRGLVADVRRIVDGLAPTVLDRLGLADALQERLGVFEHSHGHVGHAGLVVTLEAAADLGALPAAVELAAFRIVTEAVTNASRHSGGASCDVRLRRGSDLIVEVRDDGRGLPRELRPGVGLLSMRERAVELGGTCSVTAGEGGRGTLVLAHLPLHRTGGPRAPEQH